MTVIGKKFKALFPTKNDAALSDEDKFIWIISKYEQSNWPLDIEFLKSVAEHTKNEEIWRYLATIAQDNDQVLSALINNPHFDDANNAEDFVVQLAIRNKPTPQKLTALFNRIYYQTDAHTEILAATYRFVSEIERSEKIMTLSEFSEEERESLVATLDKKLKEIEAKLDDETEDIHELRRLQARLENSKRQLDSASFATAEFSPEQINDFKRLLDADNQSVLANKLPISLHQTFTNQFSEYSPYNTLSFNLDICNVKSKIMRSDKIVTSTTPDTSSIRQKFQDKNSAPSLSIYKKSRQQTEQCDHSNNGAENSQSPREQTLSLKENNSQSGRPSSPNQHSIFGKSQSRTLPDMQKIKKHITDYIASRGEIKGGQFEYSGWKNVFHTKALTVAKGQNAVALLGKITAATSSMEAIHALVKSKQFNHNTRREYSYPNTRDTDGAYGEALDQALAEISTPSIHEIKAFITDSTTNIQFKDKVCLRQEELYDCQSLDRLCEILENKAQQDDSILITLKTLRDRNQQHAALTSTV